MRSFAFALVLLVPIAAHAQRTISGYPAATSISRTDHLLLQQGNASTPYTYGTPAQMFGAMNQGDVTNALGFTPLPLSGGAATGLSITGGSFTGGAITNSTATLSSLTLSGAPFRVGPSTTAQGSPTAALFIGQNAGAAFPIGTADTYGVIGIGTGAEQSLTQLGTENTCVGTWSCQYQTTGTLTAAFGVHALGSDLTAPGNTALGNDALRDAITQGGYVVAVGQHAVAHGNPGAVTGIGSQALRGASAAVVIGGTVTTGNTVSITLSPSGGTPAGITGLPLTVSHTVAGGDTLSSIATALTNSINGVVNGPSYFVGAYEQDFPDGTAVVSLDYPGTTTTGWAITVTASTNSGATETTSIVAGSQPQQTTVVGANAMQGAALGAVTNDTVFGDSAGSFITTGSYNALFGGSAGYSLTSGGGDVFLGALIAQTATIANDDTCAGFWTCQHITSGSNNTVAGARAGQSITTGNYITILGHGVGSATVATGSGVILLGSGAVGVDTPAAGTSNYINIENILTVTGTNTPSTSAAAFAGTLAATKYVATAMPTTCSGQPTGTLWNNAGVANVCP